MQKVLAGFSQQLSAVKVDEFLVPSVFFLGLVDLVCQNYPCVMCIRDQYLGQTQKSQANFLAPKAVSTFKTFTSLS